MTALLVSLFHWLAAAGVMPPEAARAMSVTTCAPAAQPAPIPEPLGGFTRSRATADADISNGF